MNLKLSVEHSAAADDEVGLQESEVRLLIRNLNLVCTSVISIARVCFS